MTYSRSAFVFSMLFLNLTGATAMAIEEPEFKVESKNSNYEIRAYGPTLVAETTIEAEFDRAGNAAFKILADYIFGNNRAKTKITMTAPVTQQPDSEKIAMTAPVNQIKEMAGYLVQFTMPKKYTLDTLPLPNDPRVKIRQLPPRRVAVYTYSGSWSEQRYNEKLEDFKTQLNKNGVTVTGKPVFARFNSPFQLWFLRRNEIWLEIVH